MCASVNGSGCGCVNVRWCGCDCDCCRRGHGLHGRFYVRVRFGVYVGVKTS